MNALTKHHDRAMDLAEMAEAARLRKETARHADLLAKALAEELKAVALCDGDEVPEPTFSVLHRSAASLAIDCRQYRQAEKLAARALAGEPPPEIAGELRELLSHAQSLGAADCAPAPIMRKAARRIPTVRLLAKTAA